MSTMFQIGQKVACIRGDWVNWVRPPPNEGHPRCGHIYTVREVELTPDDPDHPAFIMLVEIRNAEKPFRRSCSPILR